MLEGANGDIGQDAVFPTLREKKGKQRENGKYLHSVEFWHRLLAF